MRNMKRFTPKNTYFTCTQGLDLLSIPAFKEATSIKSRNVSLAYKVPCHHCLSDFSSQISQEEH